jgi:hypothetical protein
MLNFSFRTELGSTSYALTGDPITFQTLPPYYTVHHVGTASIRNVFGKKQSQG